MFFNKKKIKVVINVLHHENGYGAKVIKNFVKKNWSTSSLNKLLAKIYQTGTVDCKPGSGKKHKLRFGQNVIRLRSWY